MNEKEINKRVELIKKVIPDWSIEKEKKWINSNIPSDFLNEKISEFIDEVGVSKVLENIDIDDIVDLCNEYDLIEEIGVDKMTSHFLVDSVLDEYDNDEIASYLADNDYDFTDFVDSDRLGEKLSDEELLILFCRRKNPRGILDKQRIKEIVNDYIDNDLQNQCF